MLPLVVHQNKKPSVYIGTQEALFFLFFLGKTVFLLTNNLHVHGRTRRRQTTGKTPRREARGLRAQPRAARVQHTRAIRGGKGSPQSETQADHAALHRSVPARSRVFAH